MRFSVYRKENATTTSTNSELSNAHTAGEDELEASDLLNLAIVCIVVAAVLGALVTGLGFIVFRRKESVVSLPPLENQRDQAQTDAL